MGFGGNTAALGGGAYLEVNSKFYSILLEIKYPIIQYNSCIIQHYMEEQCILQMKLTTVPVPAYLTWSTQPLQNVHFNCWCFLEESMLQINYVTMEFNYNTAVYSGTDIFGGLLD